ncbi:MAG TPA: AbrB/MazE/SpoVT family DNA-binding domain-containing protein [Thermoanaerobaculia bacterium]
MNGPADTTTTIDGAGRLVVPKEVRDLAGLEPGVPLLIRYRDGRIEIEPKPRAVRFERRGRVQVAVAVDPGEPLTEDVVGDTLRQLRERDPE